MAMMALVTTAMTTPVLQWLYPLRELRKVEAESADPGDFTVVVPVSLPSSGPGLVEAAFAMVPEDRCLRLYGLHLRRSAETTIPELDPGEPLPAAELALQPLLRAAQGQALQRAAAGHECVRPLVFVSHRPAQDIVDVARVKGADLLVMGWHKPVISNTVLGGVVHDVMDRAHCDVAVYVERKKEAWRRILVPYLEYAHDEPALDAALRIAKAAGVALTVLRVVGSKHQLAHADNPFASRLRSPVWRAAASTGRVQVRMICRENPVDAVVEEVRSGGYDLVVIGVAKAWGLTPAFFGVRHERLVRETAASLLIVRNRLTPKKAGSPEACEHQVARDDVQVGARLR
jgi:nucleotide-binding universal stress UspA family protein